MKFDPSREKVIQVFNFLKEFNRLKTPPISDIKNYDWKLCLDDLPTFPTIERFSAEESFENDGMILKIKRPQETHCPKPPVELGDWLERGWENLVDGISYLKIRNYKDENDSIVVEKFGDDSARVSALEKWKKSRSEWLANERPVREAAEIYSKLFSLQGTLEREGEKFQLYIADGHFRCTSQFGAIDHPIILRKVELVFEAEKNEFIIQDCAEPSEIYTTLLRFHELTGDAILDCKNKITENEIHPLGTTKTDEFLRYFIARFFKDGEFVVDEKLGNELIHPHIFRKTNLILSTKSQGFTDAIEKLIEAIPLMEEIPEALLRIIGLSPTKSGEIKDVSNNSKDVDFLLTKPSNKEQEAVIRKLEKTGAVLVQGPPGTGKSHTIANIIGHLLGQGKKIIVASHTSKALNVVREKVVDELKPLCVSVLDNEQESKAQLASSINQIVTYHAQNDKESLKKSIAQLSAKRIELKEKLKFLENEVLEIRKNEYTDIVIAGESINPIEAGKIINEHSEKMLWIPSPVNHGAPFPLDIEELNFLYNTNKMIPHEVEMALEGELPPIQNLIPPDLFKKLCGTMEVFKKKNLEKKKHLWGQEKNQVSELEEILKIVNECRLFLNAEKWLVECIESTSDEIDEKYNSWTFFVHNIQDLFNKIKECEFIDSKFMPEVPATASYEIALEVYNHLNSGKKLGGLSLMFKSNWKEFISSVKVIDGEPKTKEHFEAIVKHLEMRKYRKELHLRWERQVVSLGGNSLPELYPERIASSFTEIITKAVVWNYQWNNAVIQIEKQGFNYQLFNQDFLTAFSGLPKVEKLKALSDELIDLISLRIDYLKSIAIRDLVKINCSMIQKSNVNNYGKAVTDELEKTLRCYDFVGYEKNFNTLSSIIGMTEDATRRRSIIQKLAFFATGWAEAIKYRIPPHDSVVPPENINFAWKVRQIKDILDLRHNKDYIKVQNEAKEVKKLLEKITTQYVKKLAWLHQKENTPEVSWQALQDWLLVQRKITKTGKGKRDAVFHRESRKLIKKAKDAVPVWIMPISKIGENFDLGKTMFDVLILDEASQSDVTALIAFSIAKQVIVVGDDKQVTPLAIGTSAEKIQNLVNEFLKEIPGGVVYDGTTSIYDLAAKFGEKIPLWEHFRCVPDIISFSNNLSYEGRIKPLRESASSPFDQHVIAHRVIGTKRDNDTNLEEAWEIASIIGAMIDDPAYFQNDEGKKVTFGVISLKGKANQQYEIEKILQENIPSHIYHERKILCGSAAHFQGDERDVVFLSLVDSSNGEPQSLRQDKERQKRYNVAASRARNQLWVIHSLNPDTDLKAGDLRLRLIRHAENPKSLGKSIEIAHGKAESPFEKAVISDLIREGYHIVPQWQVGAYRLDMVVVGKDNKKIVIECDGDKYHTIENLADDIYRQSVLERLGWKFLRIRGSEYYKNPSSCMKNIFSQLEINEIDKLALEQIDGLTKKNDFSVERERILVKARILKEEWQSKKEKRKKVA